MPSVKRSLEIILAQPRGICAGVVRAIDIVERALEGHGAPVYVRHEIVHNKHDEHLMHRNPRSESIHGVERPRGPTRKTIYPPSADDKGAIHATA